MQRDKALLQLGGQTLLERAVQRLEGMGFAVTVSGHAGAGAEAIADNYRGAGPLAGLEAVLAHYGDEAERMGEADALVLFVPVDVPLLPDAFVELLWARAVASGAWATVPSSLGRPQPLCAVYDARLGPRLSAALAAGERKVMRALEQAVPAGGFDRFSAERTGAARAMPDWSASHRWFLNANTPEDWDALQQVAAEPGAGRKSGEARQPRI